MALLAQRIVSDQPLGRADGFRPALLTLLLTGEPLEHVGVKPGEPFAFFRQPLVIAALQELADRTGGGISGCCLREGYG